MSLSTGTGKLSFALKALRAQWQTVSVHWKDEVSREFDEHHLQPIEQELMATLNATNILAQVLIRAKQECE